MTRSPEDFRNLALGNEDKAESIIRYECNGVDLDRLYDILDEATRLHRQHGEHHEGIERRRVLLDEAGRLKVRLEEALEAFLRFPVKRLGVPETDLMDSRVSILIDYDDPGTPSIRLDAYRQAANLLRTLREMEPLRIGETTRQANRPRWKYRKPLDDVLSELGLSRDTRRALCSAFGLSCE